MTKSELRKQYRTIRKTFSKEEVEQKSHLIFEKIQSLDLSEIDIVHIFLPIEKNNEINTFPVVQWLFEQGKRVVVPVVEGESMLNAEITVDYKTEIKTFDIPEPISFTLVENEAIDLVFVPMFVADQNGNRVGYGGGFYDRFLAQCREDVVKIGLTYFEVIDKIDDTYLGDIGVDVILSPTEIVSFSDLASKVMK